MNRIHVALAVAMLAIQEQRTSPAANAVLTGGHAYVFFRREETPAPHFPYALGAAELWGRWCFPDEASFEAFTAADATQALAVAGWPPTD